MTPGQGTKIPHTLWHSKKKKKLREIPGKMRKRKRRKKKTGNNRRRKTALELHCDCHQPDVIDSDLR